MQRAGAKCRKGAWKNLRSAPLWHHFLLSHQIWSNDLPKMVCLISWNAKHYPIGWFHWNINFDPYQTDVSSFAKAASTACPFHLLGWSGASEYGHERHEHILFPRGLSRNGGDSFYREHDDRPLHLGQSHNHNGWNNYLATLLGITEKPLDSKVDDWICNALIKRTDHYRSLANYISNN